MPTSPKYQNSFQISQIFKYKENESIKILEENKTEYLHNLEGQEAPFKHYFKAEPMQEKTN